MADTHEVTVGGVRVVNNNDFTISDMFDGVPFTFDPGKAETIPPDAAGHIFGWSPEATPAEMLLYCQKRHGWNTPEVVRANNHTKWFGQIEFKPVRFRMVEVTDDESALPTVAASPRAPRRDKLAEAVKEAEARHAGP